MQPLMKDKQNSYLPGVCRADKHPALPVVNQEGCVFWNVNGFHKSRTPEAYYLILFIIYLLFIFYKSRDFVEFRANINQAQASHQRCSNHHHPTTSTPHNIQHQDHNHDNHGYDEHNNAHNSRGDTEVAG